MVVTVCMLCSIQLSLPGTGEVCRGLMLACAAVCAPCPPTKRDGLVLGSCAAGVCNYSGNGTVLVRLP